MFGGKTLGKILDSLRQYLQIDLAQNMENNIIHVYSMVPPKTLNKNQYHVFLTNSHTVISHVLVPNIRESPQMDISCLEQKHFTNILTV
jgi:hypothetical protein